MSVRYPKEVHDYIREHLSDYAIDEMADQVNSLFSTSFDYGKMKSYYKNHKLHTGKRARFYSKEWPKEVVDVIEANVAGRSYAELMAIIKEETGREYEMRKLRAFLKNHKLKTGRTGYFEKGHVPWTKGKRWDDYMSPEAQANSRKKCFEHAHIPDNLLPVGTTRVTRDGYVIIKVQEKGAQGERWTLLHRLRWEETNGPIPEGKMVGFKDGNALNCELDNLYLLSLAENAIMNKRKLRSSDPELTEAGHKVAQLLLKSRERKKEINGSRKK